jgi:putative redox protein
MVKVEAVYTGQKHTRITHGPSQSVIETDAPKDNNGKGETFSPTDLTAAALGSCLLTVMAIRAEQEGIDMNGARAEVVKEMTSNPRRVAKLIVKVTMPAGIPLSAREGLEETARGCPVARSLSAALEAPMTFVWT